MKTESLLKKFSGYLVVCADGPFCERLINICMNRKMNIRDIHRCGNNRVTFSIDIASYLKIRTPARRTKSHVRIIKRCGLPFIIQKYKKRRFIFIIVFILAVALWYSSTHIMGITVVGNERLSVSEITSALSECGLSLGMRTSDIDNDTLRNKMMLKIPDLGWIGFNANGSRIYVEVVERLLKEQGIEKNAPAQNLVASKDGEIERLEIREGQTMVKPGSGVRQGDVLVSGILNSSNNGIRYVSSRGEVFAKTRYTKKRAYPVKYNETVETGRKTSRYTLSVLNLNLPLFFNSVPPYTSFKHENDTKEYRTPLDFIPSLFVSRDTYIENSTQGKTRTFKEAAEFGISELTAELKSELPEGAEIISENNSHTLTERNEVEVSVEIICRENIAVPSVIEMGL